MEDQSHLENLETLMASVKAIRLYSNDNYARLDRLMQEYWLILKDLHQIMPAIFSNLSTNGITDLINRSNLTGQASDPLEKNARYKDYWDYLMHMIKITIEYIMNYLPQSLACTDGD